MVAAEVLRAVRAASVGEIAWVDGSAVHVRGVLPLVGPGGPVLAFPYSHRSLAEQIATAAGAVVLTVSEARGTGSAFRPLALRCRPRLSEDREGVRFGEELLDQELLRWPPARALADSPMLRREHWWWLPRLLVDLEVLDVEPFATRSEPSDHVLAVDQGENGLALAVARVDQRVLAHPAGTPTVDVRHGTPGRGPAVVFGQDLSFPDLERWGQWSWSGQWDGAYLEVAGHPETVGLPPVPGILQRWRRHRALERACRRELGEP